MFLSVCDISGLDEASASALAEPLLSVVPPLRRGEALRYKSALRRYMTLKSFCMLQDIVGHPLPDWQTGEHGKPYFETENILFSISHCRHAIAVALSDTPIGIDVESLDHRVTPSLVEYTMNEEERRYISSGQPSEAGSRFIELWTRKEAYLKLLGTGIDRDMHNVLSGLPSDIDITTTVNTAGGYALSVACRR